MIKAVDLIVSLRVSTSPHRMNAAIADLAASLVIQRRAGRKGKRPWTGAIIDTKIAASGSPYPQIDGMLRVVAAATGVNAVAIRSKDRRGRVVQTRHLFCFAAEMILGALRVEVAETLACDRSTVAHSINWVSRELSTNAMVKKMWKNIQEKWEYASDIGVEAHLA